MQPTKWPTDLPAKAPRPVAHPVGSRGAYSLHLHNAAGLQTGPHPPWVQIGHRTDPHDLRPRPAAYPSTGDGQSPRTGPSPRRPRDRFQRANPPRASALSLGPKQRVMGLRRRSPPAPRLNPLGVLRRRHGPKTLPHKAPRSHRCKVACEWLDGGVTLRYSESRDWSSEEDALSYAAGCHRSGKYSSIRVRYSRKRMGRWQNAGSVAYPPNAKLTPLPPEGRVERKES